MANSHKAVEELVCEANSRLRSARTGAGIIVRSGRLYLQATLPPAPGSARTRPYQQRIALAKNANPAGVAEAMTLAKELGIELARGTFCWENWRQAPEPDEPCIKASEWIRQFQENYWSRNARTLQSESTWRGDYEKAFRKIDQNEPLTPELLLQAVLATAPDTKQRQRVADKLQALAKFAGLDVDLRPLRGSYSMKRVSPRDLVPDEKIQEWVLGLKDPQERRLAGMIATYTLRPHEAWHLDTSELTNGGIVLMVLDGTKTGAREIWPCPEEWIDLFDLRNYTPPKRRREGLNNETLGAVVSEMFKRNGLPCKPYTWRHCGAVRRMQEGWPLGLIASQMGNSAQVVSSVYHHWINRTHHQNEYERISKQKRQQQALSDPNSQILTLQGKLLAVINDTVFYGRLIPRDLNSLQLLDLRQEIQEGIALLAGLLSSNLESKDPLAAQKWAAALEKVCSQFARRMQAYRQVEENTRIEISIDQGIPSGDVGKILERYLAALKQFGADVAEFNSTLKTIEIR